jgi:quinol-cytochrome oxidoreductase complex cytochrome b subunit
MLALAFGFSGYLLPWNKLAFFATQVGTQIVGCVPAAGSFLLRFLLVILTSGLLLFSSEAMKAYASVPFQVR